MIKIRSLDDKDTAQVIKSPLDRSVRRYSPAVLATCDPVSSLIVGYAAFRNRSACGQARSSGGAVMIHARTPWILGVATTLILLSQAAWATDPSFNRKQDVIYGRKFGTALTMDVFTPRKDARGIALILVVSGGFFSSHDAIGPAYVKPFADRGYTVFAVVHGSQPRYTVPEIVQDMNRSVRFIRYHAKDYGIDPAHIGVMGASAGGHLSLMLG